MKYFIIAGEASGDLHGAELVKALRRHDAEAQFSFLGGDLMAQATEVEPIIHYRNMAFMGFTEVAQNLRKILGFMKRAKQALIASKHDALILIDYPSFNLKIAEFAHKRGIPVFYFISPKVWVWKEFRVKSIKKFVDRMFCILPFEPTFYRKHDYEVEYVGNPTVGEIAEAREQFLTREAFAAEHNLNPNKPLIAIVPGSRGKEIRQNLPVMLEAAMRHPDHQIVIAGAPGIEPDHYVNVMTGCGVTDAPPVIFGKTFEIVHHARAAIVTSGTATLETAILRTPQVACFRMNGSKWVWRFYRFILKGDYITLPNLIAGKSVIAELTLHHCNPDNIDANLAPLLHDSEQRQQMLSDYERIADILTDKDCTDTTARRIVSVMRSAEK